MPSYRPIATLNIRVNQYQPLADFAYQVVVAMTGNLSFTTPSPTLASITTAADDVVDAIGVWGPQGNRGSHAELLDLRNKALILRNLLLQEMGYVQTTAYLAGGNDYVLIASIISTSAFSVKNAPTPQGLLAQPQSIHQVFSPTISQYTPKIAFKKPIGLHSPNNVHGYQILRGATNDPNLATILITVTKTSYIDTTAVPGQQYFYFARGVNTNGPGVFSADLAVSVPL